MLPDLTIDPFYFGPVLMYPWGIFVGIAICVGYSLLMWRTERVGLRTDVAKGLIITSFIVGTLFAHWFDVLFYHPEDLLTDPWIMLNIPAGLSTFGSLIGAYVGGVTYLKIRKQPFWAYSDVTIFCFTGAWFFGRLGCLVAFDHPGPITDSIFGMPYHGPLAEPGIRHNMALPEVVWSGLLMAYFLVEFKKPKFTGWTTAMYGLTYMPTRILLDFIRVSERTYLGLTPAQYVAIAGFIACIFFYRWRKRVGHLLIPDGQPHRMPDGQPVGPPTTPDAPPAAPGAPG